MGFWDSLTGFFKKQSKTQMDMEYGQSTTMTPPASPSAPETPETTAAPEAPAAPVETTKDEALDMPAETDTGSTEE